MKKNKVDFDFQFKVRKYLGKYLKENKEREKEEEIYNKLSKNIKNEYLYQIYGKKLLTIPFFKENFSEKSILSISNIIKKVELAPGETLVKVLILKYIII